MTFKQIPTACIDRNQWLSIFELFNKYRLDLHLQELFITDDSKKSVAIEK